MNESVLSYVIAPVVTAVIAGISYLVKRYFEKKDEEQKEIFRQRDEDKAEMKADIEELKSQVKATNKRVNDIAGIIIGCEHPDCPSRKILSEYMKGKEE